MPVPYWCAVGAYLVVMADSLEESFECIAKLKTWKKGMKSIKCLECKHWVHKKCSGVRGRLVEDPDYVCPRCCDQAQAIDNRPVTQVDVDGMLLNFEPWRHAVCWWRMQACHHHQMWYCLGKV